MQTLQFAELLSQKVLKLYYPAFPLPIFLQLTVYCLKRSSQTKNYPTFSYKRSPLLLNAAPQISIIERHQRIIILLYIFQLVSCIYLTAYCIVICTVSSTQSVNLSCWFLSISQQERREKFKKPVLYIFPNHKKLRGWYNAQIFKLI